MSFPGVGTDWATLKSELVSLKSLDLDWRRGRLPAFIYYLNDDVHRVQTEAYALYSTENGLGEGRAFKSLTRMLDDIQAMVFDLYHCPPGAGMSFTSGGTESIFEAVKTARKWHRKHRGPAKGRLNVVAPYSAHATLDKAGQILDVDIVRTPLGAEWRADVDAMDRAINDDTIMMFASAACFPYGVFDPIERIGALAQSRKLWLHVDGCWSGFVSPFAKELGYSIPRWDLEVPGVTSMSSDIHKFGYSAKGASVLLFRDGAMKEYERFEFSGWPRGTYATPTFLGSRPAGSIASAWAVMRYLGRSGYVEATRQTMDATMAMIRGINQIEGLQCLEPTGEANLYAYLSTDPDVDIMAVADVLLARGWFPGRMREPLSIQQGVNPVHLPVAEEYVQHVREAVEQVRADRRRGAFDARTY